MSAGFRLRWRADATGHVARWAGEWASGPVLMSREHAEKIRRACPNGDQMELVAGT